MIEVFVMDGEFDVKVVFQGEFVVQDGGELLEIVMSLFVEWCGEIVFVMFDCFYVYNVFDFEFVESFFEFFVEL